MFVRVVMRREQVLKICLNHVLTPEIEYLPKDDKTWLFSAPDFSEGEILRQQFCLRFKSAEIAQDFKKAVESSLKKITDKNGKTNVCHTYIFGASVAFLALGVLIVCSKNKKL